MGQDEESEIEETEASELELDDEEEHKDEDESEEEEEEEDEHEDNDELEDEIEHEQEQEENIIVESPKEPLEKVEACDLPLSVVIEVGRMKMSVQKLMELQPGNVLDINLGNDSSVDIVVNGKRIGRGELLRVGNAIGVRVLDLG